MSDTQVTGDQEKCVNKCKKLNVKNRDTLKGAEIKYLGCLLSQHHFCLVLSGTLLRFILHTLWLKILQVAFIRY